MLQKFRKSIDETIVKNIDLSKMLPLLRDLVRNSILNDNFRVACINNIVDSIENWDDRDKPWNAPAIIYNKDLNYSVRIIFWPAFYENNPHQHKTWSVTGVLSNELDINIYTLLDTPKRLQKNRMISAKDGEVGYLFPECIHNVSNPSHNLSASIHIFNNLPGIENAEENAIWYPSPRKHNLSKGLTERALSICLSLLSKINTQMSLELIDRIFMLASLPVKFISINELCNLNMNRAAINFKKLEYFLKI